MRHRLPTRGSTSATRTSAVPPLHHRRTGPGSVQARYTRCDGAAKPRVTRIDVSVGSVTTALVPVVPVIGPPRRSRPVGRPLAHTVRARRDPYREPGPALAGRGRELQQHGDPRAAHVADAAEVEDQLAGSQRGEQ